MCDPGLLPVVWPQSKQNTILGPKWGVARAAFLPFRHCAAIASVSVMYRYALVIIEDKKTWKTRPIVDVGMIDAEVEEQNNLLAEYVPAHSRY